MNYQVMPIHIFWLLGMGVMAVIVVGVVLLVVWIARGGSGPTHQPAPAGPAMPPGAPGETPLDILARRFAKGEITAEEYQKGRDLLGGGGKAP